MLRYEQNDYYSAPPGPYPETSPSEYVPMSPPAHPRPQFYAPQGHAPQHPLSPPQNRHGRRRASTSAAANAAAVMGIARPGGFPMLQLTDHQTAQLRGIESKLLEQYLERYDAFVGVDQRAVDTGLWKQVRQGNGVKAYKRRGAVTSRSSSRASMRARSGLRGRAASVANVAGDADEPMLLVVGSIDGSLEDVLYGAVWHSRDERSTRTYFTKDGIVDASVLASLESPSPMHPFRSLAVKWSLKRSMRSASVIKDRDFVFLGATGTIRSRSDERIGYELRHSLKIPSCPPIEGSGIVRAEIMSCSFFRQMRGGRVEVFHQASFDAGGGLLSILAWNHAVDNYIGFASIIECSFTKKLVRAVQWSSENPPAKTDDDPAKPWDPEEKRCGVCGQQSSSLQRTCAVCRVWVCSHCSMRKEIFTPLPGRPPVARCFCKTCLLKIQRDDPTDYVLRELEQFEHRTATEYAPSAEIAVLEPRNGEMSPPPPPPPPSEASEAVFFAIDASPPPLTDGGVPPTGRRRQGSVPMLPVPSSMPPPMSEPTRYSERVPLRKRFVSDANDENSAPNPRGSIEYRDSGDGRVLRDLAAVGRSRQQAAATSSRATHASKNPRGEILLRSDAARKKWRHRELEQEQQHQQDEYVERNSEVTMPHRKTEVVVKPSGATNRANRRRVTVIGSEGIPHQPMPPQPQLQSHRYRQPITEPMMSNELASERRGSIADSGSRLSAGSMNSEIPPPPPPSSQYSDTSSEVPPPPPSHRGAVSDTDEPSSRGRRVPRSPNLRARAIFLNLAGERQRAPSADDPMRAPERSDGRGIREQRPESQSPNRRPPSIDAHLRAERQRTASADDSGHAQGQRFLSQYEELVPRSASLLGEQPLLEKRPHTLLPTPEPQALTSRRAQQQQQQRQAPQQPTERVPPSSRPTSRSRAPAPSRPDGPMQVRLSLLERHQQELLQREHEELKREQRWIQHEQEQYQQSQQVRAKQPPLQQRHTYEQPQTPEPTDEEQPQREASPPDNQQQSDSPPTKTAREKDELEVNALLAELCEIARMTSDYTRSSSSSMLAAAASTSTHDRERTRSLAQS